MGSDVAWATSFYSSLLDYEKSVRLFSAYLTVFLSN